MNAHQANSHAQEKDNGEIETMLAEWMAAMSQFHQNYRKLSTHIARMRDQPASNQMYIGQCSFSHLQALMATMETQLIILIQNVDQINTQGSKVSATEYQTISGHTTVLNGLNQEARIIFRLMSLPAV